MRAHWSKKEWDELIGSVMSQVFATAEVDDSTTHPLRLNSQGRMRWLCDRTMQLEKEVTELKATMNTKLDAVTELLKQMAAK